MLFPSPKLQSTTSICHPRLMIPIAGYEIKSMLVNTRLAGFGRCHCYRLPDGCMYSYAALVGRNITIINGGNKTS